MQESLLLSKLISFQINILEAESVCLREGGGERKPRKTKIMALISPTKVPLIWHYGSYNSEHELEN